jgi:hypothetical protein
MKKLLLFILLLLPFACVNDNINDGQDKSGDYIVFGDYYGMCAGGHCVRMYLLNANSLFEDSRKDYPSSFTPYEGNFSMNRNDKFDDVKALLTQIPEALINSEEKVLGCPDCSDGGGIYIETRIEGQLKFWLIDKQRVPAGLENFLALVNEKISLLN